MKKLFTILVITCTCTLLKLDLAYDSPLSKVMVVISDKSISKYNDAAKGFVESIPFDPEVVEIGVLSKKKITSIRKMIKKKRPDLLYCIGSKAMDTICMDFPKIPFVFSSAINWEKFKLPEKANGIAAKVSVEMQITLFRFIFPSIRRIGVIYSPKYNKEWFIKAKQTGIRILSVPKDIDALMSVGFGVAQAAIATEASLKQIEQINPKLKEKLTNLLTSNEILLPIVSSKSRGADKESINKLITILKAMSISNIGKENLATLSIDKWASIPPDIMERLNK